jgi:glutathione peroxidase
MLKILLYSFALLVGTVVSIYSLIVPSVDDGSVINFNNYRGKKMLIVNTASNSSQAYQLSQLQELYEQHHDSVMIIAFPSNSFGKESRSDAQLKTYLRDTLGITFPVAAKSNVAGTNPNMVFKWLANKSQNEVLNGKVTTDYQKFLIDNKGSIVGVFDSSTGPLSTRMQDAIHNSNY